MSPFLIVVLVVLGIGAAIGIVVAVRRQRYVKALRSRGWEFESNPGREIANGLLVPPFGIGFERATDEQVVGRTRSGTGFQVFEYERAGDARVVCMPLPFPLPELVIGPPDDARRGVAAAVVGGLGPGMVRCDDDAFARTFVGIVQGPLAAFAATTPPSIAVDGDQLTVVGAPKDPDELERYLDAVAPIAAAVQAQAGQLQPWRQAPAPRRLGFYRRPSWEYRHSDDALLEVVDTTRSGHNHRTEHVVHGDFYPGCRFVAFIHHWQTTHTVTTSNGNGGTTTRTETRNHQETIHEVMLPFACPDLEVTNDSRWRRLLNGGGAIDVESSVFNEAFDVFSSSPKFAHDVIHPRQMEYLLAVRPRPFSITGGRVRLSASAHEPDAIAAELGMLAGFVARIPVFVWQDLGVPQAPLRLSPQGQVEVVSA